MRIWLLKDKEFRSIDENDSRLDWNLSPYCGMVRMKEKGCPWFFFGRTKQEAIDRANAHDFARIKEFQTAIKNIRSKLWKLSDCKTTK